MNFINAAVNHLCITQTWYQVQRLFMAPLLAESTDICDFQLTMFAGPFHVSCFRGHDFLQLWRKLLYQGIEERKELTSQLFPHQAYQVGFIISPFSDEETEGSDTVEEGSAFQSNPKA